MMRSFCKKTPKWSHTPKDTTRLFRGQFTSIVPTALAKLKAMANEDWLAQNDWPGEFLSERAGQMEQ